MGTHDRALSSRIGQSESECSVHPPSRVGKGGGGDLNELVLSLGGAQSEGLEVLEELRNGRGAGLHRRGRNASQPRRFPIKGLQGTRAIQENRGRFFTYSC